ncbi:MAG: TonB-dependent receptor plug domain-containing protein [Prevotellaceae bacterium]|jgi:iron complex outermembrane receptor protein|nr:TonB-dependent receptor plug domain-containing protein [Prevotellaceae bacterium]
MTRELATFFLIIIFYSSPYMGRAIDIAHATDTVRQLQEVKVFDYKLPGPSENKKYSAGTGFIHFNNQQLLPAQHLSLGNYLETQTAIFIKESGKGMRSSVSIRGTSAAHTTVKWNGLSLAMTTMGQTDFSHLPLLFFDEVSVHLGGESALYGNGTMGGSIMMSTLPKFEPKVHGSVHQSIGSYGYTFSGLILRIAGKNWESRTNLLYTEARNNYTFKNTTTYEHRRDTLKNAAYKNWGVLQEFYYKPNGKHLLSARFWYMDFYREIQPPMSSTKEVRKQYDNITDRNFRTLLNYQGEITSFKINAQAGYAHDYELFKIDVIAADKLPVLVDAEYKQAQWSVKIGANSEYIKPEVYSYAAGIEEWRTDCYLFALWKPTAQWNVSAGLRQLWVTDVTVPLAPSLGASYALWQNAKHELKWRTAFSRNIKIPTLNDRYWGGLKNTHLRPEIGLSGETGFNYDYTPRSGFSLKADITAYYNRISDWIHWRLIDSMAYPINMNLVDSYGIELAIQLVQLLVEWRMEWKANYAYTPVIKREGINELATGIGYQVPYQPRHVANAISKVGYKKIFGQAGFHLIGSRHTTDRFEVTNAYALLDLSLGYTLDVNPLSLMLLLQVNNVTGTNYQNMHNYAMPGRNYAIILRCSF